MADTKTPVAAPEAPVKPAKAKREPYKEVFPTEADAIREAQGRTKGPRRAFKTTLNGKVVFCVANNEGRAGGVAFASAGGQVEELGRAARAPKQLGADAIMAAVGNLPEDQRKAVIEQLKLLAAAKK